MSSFEKKKIQMETLNEYLTEVRARLNLSLQEVAAKTGIKLKFLEWLEDGQFNRLPPDVYVLGFMRQLSQLYSTDYDVLVAQYKKEKNIQQMMGTKQITQRWKIPFLNRLVVTPKLIALSVGILFVVLTVGYVVWQILSINKTPSLTINEPQDRQVVAGSAVNVVGQVSPGATLTINGNSVFVDDNGNFKAPIGITAGSNLLDFTAANKFGKSVDKEISVIGQAPFITTDSQLSLQLVFSGEVTLGFSIDDTPAQTINFHAGDSKILLAQNKIVITTSNAGATKAILNNQDLGALGRNGEKLINVPFLAQAAAPK